MKYLFILLFIIAVAMMIVSLISPRTGLFFAAPARQTKFWGFNFWWLVSLTLFLAVCVVTFEGTVYFFVACIMAIICIVLAKNLRKDTPEF